MNIVRIDVNTSRSVDVLPSDAAVTTNRLPITQSLVEIVICTAVTVVRTWITLFVGMPAVDLLQDSYLQRTAINIHVASIASVP